MTTKHGKRVLALLSAALLAVCLLTTASAEGASEVTDVGVIGQAAPAETVGGIAVEPVAAEAAAAPQASLLDDESSSLALRFFVNGTETYYKNLAEVSVTSSNGKLTSYGDSFAVEDGAALTLQVGSFGEAYRLDRLELGRYGGESGTIPNGATIAFAEPDYPKSSMYYLAVYLTTNEAGGYHAVHRGESPRGSMAILNPAGTTIAAQKTDGMVNVQITPYPGWRVNRVTATGIGGTVTAVRNAMGTNLFTFAMPGNDVTVTAYYLREGSSANEGCALDFVTSNPGCEVLREQNNRTMAPAGDWVTCYAYPKEGWLIDSLTITDKTSSQTVPIDSEQSVSDNGRLFTFRMPEGDARIEAAFRMDLDGGFLPATITAGAGGSVMIKSRFDAVTVREGSASVPEQEGRSVKLVITPDDGYSIQNISGASVTDASYEHGVMTAYVTVPAGGLNLSVSFYASGLYTVTPIQSQNGTVLTSVTSAYPGEAVNLVLSPASGCYAKSVTVTTASGIPVQTEGLLCFIMPAEHVSVSAEFAKTANTISGMDYRSMRLPAAVTGEYYEVNLGSDNGASVWSLFQGSYPAGLSLQYGILYGTPKETGSFGFVIEASASANDRVFVICDLNVTDAAYSVSAAASPADAGQASLDFDTRDQTRDGNLRSGAEVTARANAKPGYVFTGWYAGDALVSSDSNYAFCVAADTELTARFMPYTTYPVSVQSADPSMGSAFLNVSENGGSWFVMGSLQQLGERDSFRTGVKAAEGYHFKQWLEDPTLPEEFTVTGVTGAYVLTAVFEKDALPGDLNGDEEVNAKDVTTLRRHLAGGYDQTVAETLTDVNRDGYLNAKDVTHLRRFLAGGYGIVLS